MPLHIKLEVSKQCLNEMESLKRVKCQWQCLYSCSSLYLARLLVHMETISWLMSCPTSSHWIFLKDSASGTLCQCKLKRSYQILPATNTRHIFGLECSHEKVLVAPGLRLAYPRLHVNAILPKNQYLRTTLTACFLCNNHKILQKQP